MKPVSELSDNELSMLFAEKVAGWTNLIWDGVDAKGSPPGETDIVFYLSFATNANAVLPWLERVHQWRAESVAYSKPENRHMVYLWQSEVQEPRYMTTATAPTFPRAACIALLAAKGITEVDP